MGRSESRIWEAVGAAATPSLLGGVLHRVVESQEQVATRELVDGDLAAQTVLEAEIERSKPPRPTGTERLDYLLATPWRYPPLRHGSRFGTRHEPSLFYGSGGAATALAETAYYRFVFRDDMAVAPATIGSRHTSFEARYRTARGLKLQGPPFETWQAVLTHPSDYGPTQALGAALRDAGVAAFEFTSARDPSRGHNVALVEPGALVSTRHARPGGWFCSTDAEAVTFSRRAAPGEILRFALSDFLVGGALPRPA